MPQALPVLSESSPCPAGVGMSSVAVESIKGLPQQQQLVVCAASRLLSEAGSAGDTPFKALTNSLQLSQSAQKKAKVQKAWMCQQITGLL